MSTAITWRTHWRLDAAALLLALGATAGVYVVGITPALAARNQERARRDALGPQEQVRDQAQAALRALRERLAAAKSEMLASPLVLEPVTQLNRRLDKITEMAAADGLALDQFTPGPQSRSADGVTVTLHLVGRGAFPAAVAFLARLHERFADTVVTGLRLSGNPADQAAPATFQFDLAWYAAPAPTEADRQAVVPLQ